MKCFTPLSQRCHRNASQPNSPTRVTPCRVESKFVIAIVSTVFLLALLVDRCAFACEFNDTAGWYPFAFPLDDTNLDTIDLTGLLDTPAGKHGFLTVRSDGHFYFADGTRARFFGVNIVGGEAFPGHNRAQRLAARLAKYGVNLVRIHAVDSRKSPLIDYSRGDSRHLNLDALERLDFFFAELKRRGIYVYFDLLDYRDFTEADGVRDAAMLRVAWQWQHTIKAASCFNTRMIELQKEFATNFLTHENSYTKLRYVDDPAVAVVEITNENSLFHFHNNPSLMLPSYVDELKAIWNAWLLGRYEGRAGLSAAWTNAQGQSALGAEEDPGRGSVILPLAHLYQKPEDAPPTGERSPLRVNAMARFLFEVQSDYYQQMRTHLKQLGIKVPVTGTNQSYCPVSNYAESANDFMSRNNYWCHPNLTANRFKNLALVNSEAPKTVNPIVEVASSSVAGKPMIVPEFNFPWANEFRAEGLLLMTAYGCLQDWDGLLCYIYSPDQQTLDWFDVQSDPVRWGEFPVAALMFHRRDVAAARRTVHIGYSQADVFATRPSHRLADASPFRYFTYVSKVRNCYFNEAYQGDADLVVPADYAPAASYATARRVAHFAGNPEFNPPDGKYASDTGELVLDTRRGVFAINTPHTKGAVGFLAGAGAIELGDLSVRCTTPFAAVVLTTFDGRPLEQSRRILLTAVGRAENTGQAFTEAERTVRTVSEHGRLPVLVEPIQGEVRLSKLGRAQVWALDATGKRCGQLQAVSAGGALVVKLDQAHSPWCEIVRR